MTQRTLTTGDLVGGKYRVDAWLASGGMAHVYRATRTDLGRVVALKVLPASDDVEAQRRFLREARITARLSHPSIITLFDLGELHGPSGELAYYLVFELLEGKTLLQELEARGPFAPEEAARLAIDIARALRVAHEAGVVHRDLKPENVMMLEGGAIKLIDFGIGQHFSEAREADSITQRGVLIGTPEYMAPERATGAPLGPSVDLYALGVVLFEMLTGRRPFTHQHPVKLLLRHMNDPVPSLESAHPSCEAPPALEAVVRALLAKRPEDRPGSAGEVVALLGPFVAPERRGTPVPVATSVQVGSFLCERPHPTEPDTWIARQQKLDRVVCVKWLSPGSDAASVARLLVSMAEGALARPLGVGTAPPPEGGEPREYVVLEAPAGVALDEVVELDGPLDPEQVLDLGLALAGLLARMHARGLAHGRLAGQAVLVDPCDSSLVALTDLPLARPPSARVEAPNDLRALGRLLLAALEAPASPTGFRRAASQLRSRSTVRASPLRGEEGLRRVLEAAAHGLFESASSLRLALGRAEVEAPSALAHFDLDSEGAMRSAALEPHGAERPVIWLLLDETLQSQVIVDALASLRRVAHVVVIPPAMRGHHANELARDRVRAPWVVLSGERLSHEDPLVSALRTSGETSYVLAVGSAEAACRALDQSPLFGARPVLLARGADPLTTALFEAIDVARERRARYDVLRALVVHERGPERVDEGGARDYLLGKVT
jgi:serine/threonine protein kinase